MSIFIEKCKDSLFRSAYFFTPGLNWWAFLLAKEYYKDNGFISLKYGEAAAFALLLFPIIAPLILIILPIINLASNILLAGINLLLSPLVVPFLTVLHELKDYYRRDKVVDLYTTILENADENTWNDYVTEAVKNYEPGSERSKQFKTDLTQGTLEDHKLAFGKFFDLKGRPAPEGDNAGRDITGRILSRAQTIEDLNQLKTIQKEANEKLRDWESSFLTIK